MQKIQANRVLKKCMSARTNTKKNPGLLSGKRPPWEMMTRPQGLSKTAPRNLGKLP